VPTYEYECTDCGVIFELFQPITEDARKRLRKGDPKPCECNTTVKRRISAGGGIIFKGSGFYQTDYRSESYKKAAEADGKASTGSSDTSKSEKSGDAGKTGDSTTTGESSKSAESGKTKDSAKSSTKKKK